MAKPERGADLEKSGWKFIASVDTRSNESAAGGQYGVTVADTAGRPIGKYRYLLLEVSRTENEDPFGNTFFSEIDVIDGAIHAVPAEPAPLPLDVVKVADKYEIAFDISETPELKNWLETKLKPVCIEWYPKIVDMLPSDGFEALAVLPSFFIRTGVVWPAQAGLASIVPHLGLSRIWKARPWVRSCTKLVHIVQTVPQTRAAAIATPAGWSRDWPTTFAGFSTNQWKNARIRIPHAQVYR